jgi:hypothetical protein
MANSRDESIRSYDDVRAVRQRIEESIEESNVYQDLTDLQHERSIRETSKRQAPTARWEVDRSDSSEYPFRPPEGSVTCFWCGSDGEIIDDLEYAILSHDLEELDEIGDRVADDVGSRSISPVEEAVKEAADTPVIFDLRYDGQELAKNLYLPDMELGAITLPYNGGDLDRDKFEIVEHAAEGASERPYDYLVVTASPKLSDLEREITASLPNDIVDMKVGGTGPVAATPTVAAAAGTVAAALATAVTLKSGSDFHDRLATVGVSDRFVRQMGVRSSADELLEARREVFEEYML